MGLGGRADEQATDAGGGVHLEPFADVLRRSDQRQTTGQFERHCGRGFGLASAQIEILDLLRRVAVWVDL